MATFADLFKKATVQPTPTEGQLPTYLGGGQQRVYPQAMPGQLEAIAAQLAAGYGGAGGQPSATAPAFMQHMDATYAPMTSAPAAPAAPAKQSEKYSQHWNGPMQSFGELFRFLSPNNTYLNKGGK